MNTDYASTLKQILADILCLDTSCFQERTPLLGAIPEFDSMAVMSLIMELEDKLGFDIYDVDLSAETFGSFGSLLMQLKRYKNDSAAH